MEVRLQRPLIRQNGILYRALQFEFRDHADGSFNLVFDWSPTKGERITSESDKASSLTTVAAEQGSFRISYHTTGRVNFHGTNAGPIYCEPTYAITQPQMLAVISMPAIERLTKKSYMSPDDAIVEFPPEFAERLTLELTVAPSTFGFESSLLTRIDYPTWFSLAVSMVGLPTQIPPEAKDHFVRWTPTSGKFTRQIVAHEQALIDFHHKRMNSSHGLILYWNQGVYRAIFAVPMHLPPRLKVEFVDSQIQAEMLPLLVEGQFTATAEIRFRARGPGGYLATAQAIRSIELDAEL